MKKSMGILLLIGLVGLVTVHPVLAKTFKYSTTGDVLTMDPHSQNEGPNNAMKNNIRMHWRINPDLVSECIECGICESRCTQHLPIIDRLKTIKSVYND